MSFVDVFNIVGGVCSIVSFIPIVYASYVWWRNNRMVTIELKDPSGQLLYNNENEPLRFKIKRKFVNNADLTPYVSLTFFGGERLTDNVRQAILDVTLTKDIEKLV